MTEMYLRYREILQIQIPLGTNKIIQQGAKLINGAADIISEYPYAEKVIPKKVKSEPIQKTVDDSKYSKLNEFEKQIIDILKKSDMQIDEISKRTEKKRKRNKYKAYNA